MLSYNKLRVWYYEELALLEKYEIQKLDASKMEKLFELKESRKEGNGGEQHYMHGVLNYDILQAKRHADSLMYVPCFIPGRDTYVTTLLKKR